MPLPDTQIGQAYRKASTMLKNPASSPPANYNPPGWGAARLNNVIAPKPKATPIGGAGPNPAWQKATREFEGAITRNPFVQKFIESWKRAGTSWGSGWGAPKR